LIYLKNAVELEPTRCKLLGNHDQEEFRENGHVDMKMKRTSDSLLYPISRWWSATGGRGTCFKSV